MQQILHAILFGLPLLNHNKQLLSKEKYAVERDVLAVAVHLYA